MPQGDSEGVMTMTRLRSVNYLLSVWTIQLCLSYDRIQILKLVEAKITANEVKILLSGHGHVFDWLLKAMKKDFSRR